MLSYQKQYERLQAMTGDSDTASTTLFKAFLNEGSRKCYNIAYKENLLATATDLTEDSVYSYPLPAKCGKIDTVKVVVSSTPYPILEFTGSDDQWNALLNDGSESDMPDYYRQKANTIEFYPTFASAGNTITYRFKTKIKDMTADDYTTGNITTLANGGTAVTGSGTTWTAAMVGRYFKIDSDGVWYEIAGRSGNGAITLARQYEGTAIVAGSESYTIGEMNLLDESYSDTPIFYALYFYYLQKENTNMANTYFNLLPPELRINMLKEDSSETVSGVLSDEPINILNKNDYPLNLS